MFDVQGHSDRPSTRYVVLMQMVYFCKTYRSDDFWTALDDLI